MAEAEVLRFDRRERVNRALLVSPPTRGADWPKPVPERMLLARSARALGL